MPLYRVTFSFFFSSPYSAPHIDLLQMYYSPNPLYTLNQSNIISYYRVYCLFPTPDLYCVAVISPPYAASRSTVHHDVIHNPSPISTLRKPPRLPQTPSRLSVLLDHDNGLGSSIGCYSMSLTYQLSLQNGPALTGSRVIQGRQLATPISRISSRYAIIHCFSALSVLILDVDNS